MKVMEFLNAHREDEDPCECVILPDGSIEEPLPSHIGKLTELAGADPAVLHGHMEKSMEPLFWLAEYTGCMSVWQTRVVSPSAATQAQEDTLEELYDAALHKANTLLPALWAFLSEGAPLHEAFYSNFESEEKI